MHQEHITKLEEHDIMLVGRDGKFGLMHKVDILWRCGSYFLVTIGVVIGWMLKWGFDAVFTKH